MKLSEISDKQTVFQALMARYFPRNFRFAPQSKKIVMDHHLDLTRLKDSIDGSLEKFGEHPWITSEGPNLRYSGFSLRYNPDHQDKLDPNASSLGTPKNKRS